VVDESMLRSHCALRGFTGSLAMSVFQTLSAGNIGQLAAPGTTVAGLAVAGLPIAGLAAEAAPALRLAAVPTAASTVTEAATPRKRRLA
jgi:hypothetical protein